MAIVPKSTPQISELNRDKLNPSPLMSRQYLAEGVAHSIKCFLGSKPRVWPWAPQKPGTVARACIPALGVEKDPPQLYSKFKARLRPCQEKGGMVPGTVLRAFDPITQESEAGRSLWVWGYLRVHSKLQDSQDHTKTLSKKRVRREERSREGEVEREEGKDSKSDAQMSHELWKEQS